MKSITKKYKDGSTMSVEWCNIMSGKWPHPEDCEEVIYVFNKENPRYEQRILVSNN